MPAGSPKSLCRPSQPPVNPPEEFVQAEMKTPVPKETQVPRALQDDGSGHHPRGSLEDPIREDVVSEVLRSASPNGPNVTPGPTPPVSVQTPLFTDEQVAQLLRLHNQAPWLYGGMTMGITPQVTRPAFLPTEEDVGSQFVRSRQFQERMEAEEIRRNMEMVLEENRLLKGRLAQLESKVLDEPRFSTPESQKGVDEVQPPRKEAADPHLSGQPQKGFKEAETPTKVQEDGPRGQQGFKEAETTTEAEDGPRGQQEKAYGTDPIAQKNMEFMVLMVETMRELQKKVQEGREDAGTVKGVEVIRHGGPDLPLLPAWNPSQGPLQLGDWLLLLGPVVSDLTTTSEEWWQLMTKSTEEWYQQHMAMNPIQRLQHAATPPSSLQQERWQRLERRMSSMLLQSVTENVREELIASRRLDVFGVLTHLYLVYCPGGVMEKQTLLKSLEEPAEVTVLSEAPNALRRWMRWRSRTQEIGAIAPDPALLLKGLNRMTRRVLDAHKDLKFRVSLARSTLGVDTTPTETNVGQLATHLLAEFEQASLTEKKAGTGNNRNEAVKLKSLEAEKSEKGKGKGKDRSERSHEEESGKAKCRFFLTDQGCRKGRECSFSHELKDEKKRCYVCGSPEHFAPSCSRPKIPANGSEGSPPKPRQMKVEVEGKSSAKDSDSSSVSSQESAMKDLIDEANKVLKSLNPTSSTMTSMPVSAPTTKEADVRSEVMDRLQQQLEAMRLKPLRLQSMSSNSVLGLIDSGATHPLRPLRDSENDENYAMVEVALADGATTRLKMSPGGAMISPNSRVQPIVPMGLLAEVLNCTIDWKGGSLQVHHPQRGALPVVSSERCPQVPRQLALELIREMEDVKMGIPQQVQGFEAEVTWMKSLIESHPVLASLPGWVKERLVVSPGEWADLPVNRRLRKMMRREGFAVHMFAGESTGFTLARALQQLGAKEGWLLELDIQRGEGHDLLRDKGAYSGLLRCALEGKIKAIVRGPNCRSRSVLRHRPIEGRPDAPRPIREWGGGEYGKSDLTQAEAKILLEDDVLLWRMVFLYMVSHYVAKARGIEQEVQFSLEQPASPKAYNKEVVSFWDTKEWEALKREFGFTEETFEQGRLGGLSTKPTTFGGTLKLDVEGHQMKKGRSSGKVSDSKQLARWGPGVMSMVASALMEQVYHKTPKLRELSWSEHVMFGHIPHRRDCRVCQESQQISDQHRKIPYPLGATLSVDVAGPLKKAYDRGGGQARYMLVGAMTWRFPKGLVKMKQPPDEELEEDAPEIEVRAAEELEDAGEALGGGDPGEPPAGQAGDAESGGGDLVRRPAGPDGDAESGRGDLVRRPSGAPGHEEKEEEQPGPAIEGPDIEETELRVFRLGLPMVTKTSREVAKTTMEFVLKLKADGFHVNRIHTDQGHEFGTHFRNWARDRGIIVTRTPGDDPRGNGRAESSVKAVKCQVRKALRQAHVGAEWWPWALRYVGELNRLVRLDKKPDFPRFLQEVRVRKRSWKKSSMEVGVEKVLYLAPAPEEHGHWVVKKGDPPRLTKSILRMTTEPEDENQWLALERELMDAWTVRRRLRDKSTVKKLEGFEDPEEDRKDEVLKRNSRIVELIEEEMKKMVDDDPESVVDEMVLIGALRKMIEVPEDHEEVLQTRIISPREVSSQWHNWLPAINAEVHSLVEEKGALKILSPEEVEELKREAKEKGQKIECIPSKMVYTLKPGMDGGRKKARLVACGNFEEKKKDESTYSSGADAAAFRIMIWISARVLASLLWSLLRDQTMRDFRIHALENGQEKVLVLLQLNSEPNLWKIAVQGEEEEPTMTNGMMRGLVMSYVDDLFVTGPSYVVEAVKAKFEETWATSKPEYVGEHPVRFLGMEVKKERKAEDEREVWYVTQESYISDLLSKEHGLKERKIPISRDQSLMETTADPPTAEQIKQCQKEVGEALWLVTRTRPDLMFAVSRMGSNITKSADAVLEVSRQLKGYLLKTKEEGLKYDESPGKPIAVNAFSDASFAPIVEAMGAAESISVIIEEIYEEVEKIAWSDSQAAGLTLVADVGTKAVSANRLEALKELMGMGRSSKSSDRAGDAESGGGDLVRRPARRDGDAESGGGDLVRRPSNAHGPEEEESEKKREKAVNAIRLVIFMAMLTGAKGRSLPMREDREEIQENTQPEAGGAGGELGSGSSAEHLVRLPPGGREEHQQLSQPEGETSSSSDWSSGGPSPAEGTLERRIEEELLKIAEEEAELWHQIRQVPLPPVLIEKVEEREEEGLRFPIFRTKFGVVYHSTLTCKHLQGVRVSLPREFKWCQDCRRVALQTRGRPPPGTPVILSVEGNAAHTDKRCPWVRDAKSTPFCLTCQERERVG
ncbi:unnamed protein product [Cladocopium goreaui]|uniref:Transposon Ty5-1 protein YCL074W n=1 Tax=Cladocopium goreaui TaxID=2562237 RepID=A0A9P1FJE8_9DINO|nr:unnamed protein product [Cladocopium goreaui]